MQPGHVFPLMAQEGGVLARAGHTEACCDLARLAGHSPAAVICEIMKDDGTMARLPDLVEFARQHGLKIGAIADLIHYRSRTERLVERIGERPIRTAAGRVPAGRLPRQADRCDAPGADARRDRAGNARRWCACTSRCRCRSARLRQPHALVDDPGGARGDRRVPAAACSCCCTGRSRRWICGSAP